MKMKTCYSDQLAAAMGPYCHAKRFGDMILTSGSIPEKSDGSFVYEIREATLLTLQNLVCMVEAAGGKKTDIARIDMVLRDWNDFAAMNEVYAEFFGDQKPVRMCYQAGGIACDLPLEAQATAFVEA